MLASARALAAAFVLCMLAGAGQSQPAPYVFDTTRAEVRFSYSMPLSTGQGRFTGVSGVAEIDDAAIEQSTAEVVIDTRTLTANTAIAEGELRGKDFFAVAAYPQMRFKSRSVETKSPAAYRMSGDMTVKGVTRPIVLQIALQPPAADGTRQFRATTRIRRGDFNMTAYAFLVGEIVQIEIRATLVPAR